MQRGDDNIDHVEHFVKWNIQVRYPALFKLIQILLFPLNTLDQATIRNSSQTTPKSIHN